MFVIVLNIFIVDIFKHICYQTQVWCHLPHKTQKFERQELVRRKGVSFILDAESHERWWTAAVLRNATFY